jgi:hypothetical protein
MEQFDPYYQWLGIAPHEQPPNFYRLLGIAPFEADPNVIGAAAERQMLQVAAFQNGPYGEASQAILNELAAARACLLDPQQKAFYDQDLQQMMNMRGDWPAAVSPASMGQFAPTGFPGPAGPTPRAGTGFLAGPSGEVPLAAFHLPPGGPMAGLPGPGQPSPFAGQQAAGPGAPGQGPVQPMPVWPGQMPGSGPRIPSPPVPMAAPLPGAPATPGFPLTPPTPGALPRAIPLAGHSSPIPSAPRAAPVPLAAPHTSPASATASPGVPSPPVARTTPQSPPPPSPDMELSSIVAAAKSSSRSSRSHRSRQKDNGIPKEMIAIGGVVAAGLVILVIWAMTGKSGFEKAADESVTTPSDKAAKKTGSGPSKRTGVKTGRDSTGPKVARPNAGPGSSGRRPGSVGPGTVATPPRPGARPAPSGGIDPYIDQAIGPPSSSEGVEVHAPLQVPRHGIDQPVDANPPGAINPPAKEDPPPAHPHEDRGPSPDVIGMPDAAK